MLVAVLLVAELLLTSPLGAQPSGELWAGSAKGSTLVEVGRIWASDRLLEGFTFRFTSKDHQLTRVGFRPGPEKDQVTIAYHDKNSDDPFSFHVAYSYLPPGSVKRRRVFSGSAVGSDSRKLTDRPGPAAICGFRFDFTKPDSHLKSFGVETLPDLRVQYADKNSDDRFAWSVCLAFY